MIFTGYLGMQIDKLLYCCKKKLSYFDHKKIIYVPTSYEEETLL